MVKSFEEILTNKNFCLSLEQGNQFVFLINFGNLWQTQREKAMELIKDFQGFWKACEKFSYENNRAKKIQVIIKKFPLFRIELFDISLINFCIKQKQGFLLRKEKVVVVLVSDVVYYHSSISYKRNCDCVQYQKMQRYFSLSKVLRQYSDLTEPCLPEVCNSCWVPLQILKEKSMIKSYQQIKAFSMELDQEISELTVFLENDHVSQLQKGDLVDIYGLLAFNARFKQQQGKLLGDIQPYMIAVQINKGKSFEKKLFKFFLNLQQKITQQKPGSKIHNNFLNILEELSCLLSFFDFKAILSVLFLMMNQFYQRLTEIDKEIQQEKQNNILLVTEMNLYLGEIIKKIFNQNNVCIIELWKGLDSAEAFSMFLIQNTQKIIIIQSLAEMTKAQQQILSDVISFGFVNFNQQKIPVEALFIFLIKPQDLIKSSNTKKEEQIPIRKVVSNKIVDSCLMLLSLQQEKIQLEKTIQNYLIKNKEDFLFSSKNKESAASNEEEQLSFISGISSIFSQLKIKKNAKANQSNELDPEVFYKYMEICSENKNNQNRMISLLYISHIFQSVFQNQKNYKEVSITFTNFDFFLLFLFMENTMETLNENKHSIYSQQTKEISQGINLYLNNNESASKVSVLEKMNKTQQEVISYFLNLKTKENMKENNQQSQQINYEIKSVCKT